MGQELLASQNDEVFGGGRGGWSKVVISSSSSDIAEENVIVLIGSTVDRTSKEETMDRPELQTEHVIVDGEEHSDKPLVELKS